MRRGFVLKTVFLKEVPEVSHKRGSPLKNAFFYIQVRTGSPFGYGILMSGAGGSGRRRVAACGKDLGPRRLAPSRRFMFCPAATMSASMFTFFSLLRRNLLMPCHSLASANKGSIHTLRLRKALS